MNRFYDLRELKETLFLNGLLEAISIAAGVASLGKNVAEGNYGSAAIDAVGVAIDAIGVAVPGAPGVAGIAIQSARAAETVVDAAQVAKSSDVTPAAAAGVLQAPSTNGFRGDFVDLTTPERRRHILDGDETGGGHGPGRGVPGKSEFPSSWTDDQIIHNVSDVATDPQSVRTNGRLGRTIVEGSRDGIDIRVVLERDGTIVTGYPTNRPRNPSR